MQPVMKLLVVVAHPDDEAFGCGSLLAHATASGVESTVVCATRGELGEVAGAAGPIAREDLGRVREAELHAATTLLGVRDVVVLGWRDSGVGGLPEPDSLVAAPIGAVIAAVAEVIERVQPDVVVTLDASDGHRDHAAIRDATLAAVAQTAWRPARTYLWCLPRSLLAEFTGVPTLGTPDADITTVVDVARHEDLRWRAMRAHASQTPPYDAMSVEMQHDFLRLDRLLRIDPVWDGGPAERDWMPQPS